MLTLCPNAKKNHLYYLQSKNVCTKDDYKYHILFSPAPVDIKWAIAEATFKAAQTQCHKCVNISEKPPHCV